jgi:hypothetical protein
MTFPYRPPNDYLYSLEAIKRGTVPVSPEEVERLSRTDQDYSIRRDEDACDRLRSEKFDAGEGEKEYVFALDLRWGEWFNIDSMILNDDVNQLLRDENGDWHDTWLADRAEQNKWNWGQLDWPILGRGLAAAILNQCRGEEWLKTRRGRDRDYSTEIWAAVEIHNQILNHARDIGLEIDDWLPDVTIEDAIGYLLQKRIDPAADLVRVSDGPHRPLFSEGGQTRINPLASRLRERVYERRRERGDEGEELRDVFGISLLEVVDRALEILASGNAAEFALVMHGITSLLMIRSSLYVNKIGMHLFASLGVRTELRGVRYLSIPAMHRLIDSNFPILRCLEVLDEHNITSVYAVQDAT